MRENAHLSLSPINRRPHIAQKKKPPQVSPRRLSPQRLFVGIGIGIDDGMVIVSTIGCGFGILLHGRLRKGRGISRQLLLAHTRRALLGRHAGRLGIALLLGRQDITLALKVRIPLVVEQGVHGVAFDGLALKQHLRHQIELIATGVQDLDRTTMGLTHMR